MFKKKLTPISVVWESTLECNMNCIHCGASAGDKRRDELNTTEAKTVIDDLKKLGTKLITLMGGEPFLRSDWFTLAQYIRKQDMNLTIMSNGLLIDKEVVSKLRTLDPYAMAVSIDGGIPETHDTIRRVPGSFDQCLQALQLLRDAGIQTSVVTTVHKQNYKELPLIRNFLLNRDIAWQIQMCTPVGRFPRTLMLSKKEFYAIALFIASTRKKYSRKQLPIMGAHNFGYHSRYMPNIMLFPWNGCQAGISTLGIQSDGGIQGCLSLPNNYVEGNVRKQSIIDIWNDSNSFSYNRNFDVNDIKGDCVSCKFKHSCKGGCLTAAVSISGEEHNNPYCLRLIEKEM